MPTASHFDVLGLAQEDFRNRDESANRRLVEDAFRKLNREALAYQRRYLPDGTKSDDWRARLVEARKCLLDPERRALHIEELRKLEPEPQSGFDDRRHPRREFVEPLQPDRYRDADSPLLAKCWALLNQGRVLEAEQLARGLDPNDEPNRFLLSAIARRLAEREPYRDRDRSSMRIVRRLFAPGYPRRRMAALALLVVGLYWLLSGSGSPGPDTGTPVTDPTSVGAPRAS